MHECEMFFERVTFLFSFFFFCTEFGPVSCTKLSVNKNQVYLDLLYAFLLLQMFLFLLLFEDDVLPSNLVFLTISLALDVTQPCPPAFYHIIHVKQ